MIVQTEPDDTVTTTPELIDIGPYDPALSVAAIVWFAVIVLAFVKMPCVLDMRAALKVAPSNVSALPVVSTLEPLR